MVQTRPDKALVSLPEPRSQGLQSQCHKSGGRSPRPAQSLATAALEEGVRQSTSLPLRQTLKKLRSVC